MSIVLSSFRVLRSVPTTSLHLLFFKPGWLAGLDMFSLLVSFLFWNPGEKFSSETSGFECFVVSFSLAGAESRWRVRCARWFSFFAFFLGQCSSFSYRKQQSSIVECFVFEIAIERQLCRLLFSFSRTLHPVFAVRYHQFSVKIVLL